jgi:predicted RNA-binding protein
VTDTRNYWLDLFTGTTWKEFLDAGAEVSGFRERRWKTVQRMKPGDYLLCYLTGLSRFVAVLEVLSPAYWDETPIWRDAVFPCRVKVRVVVTLSPETAVPVLQLKHLLTIFENLRSPFAWTGHFRGSPARWSTSDGEAVVSAVYEANQNPVLRPVDPAKLARRPQILHAKMGPVTVPTADQLADTTLEPPTDSKAHTEVQWLLLKLGADMGLDLWVARNDRGRDWRGQSFSDLPRLKKELPHQFDEATNRTVELIDVLWLRGNAIVAAFEVESTTSIYSGLLRMADLIAMQPNLNIPLYLVAPEERRDKVIAEVNRPTFSHLSPPMREICRFIGFSTLRQRISQAASLTRYLRPEFLDEISESCAPEEV